MKEESTPQEFINSIMEKMYLSEFDEFKTNIKDEMAKYRSPYAIKESKRRKGMSYIIYICRVKNCSSHFEVKFDDKLISLSGEWTHNHPINHRYIESMFCLLTAQEKEKIHSLRIMGASPYFIIKNLNLSISPNQLYNYSRSALKPMFTDEISQIEAEANK